MAAPLLGLRQEQCGESFSECVRIQAQMFDGSEGPGEPGSSGPFSLRRCVDSVETEQQSES